MIEIDGKSQSVDALAHRELAKWISLAVASEGLSFVLDRSRIFELIIKANSDFSEV